MLCFGQQAFIGQRREGGYQDGAFGGFQHSRIAIINRAVQDDSRPTPGGSIIVGPHQLDSPKRADVGLASPRANQQQFTAVAAGQRRPTMIAIFQLADDTCL